MTWALLLTMAHGQRSSLKVYDLRPIQPRGIGPMAADRQAYPRFGLENPSRCSDPALELERYPCARDMITTRGPN